MRPWPLPLNCVTALSIERMRLSGKSFLTLPYKLDGVVPSVIQTIGSRSNVKSLSTMKDESDG